LGPVFPALGGQEKGHSLRLGGVFNSSRIIWRNRLAIPYRGALTIQRWRPQPEDRRQVTRSMSFPRHMSRSSASRCLFPSLPFPSAFLSFSFYSFPFRSVMPAVGASCVFGRGHCPFTRSRGLNGARQRSRAPNTLCLLGCFWRPFCSPGCDLLGGASMNGDEQLLDAAALGRLIAVGAAASLPGKSVGPVACVARTSTACQRARTSVPLGRQTL